MVAHGSEDVAEVEEGIGLVVAVPEFPEQAEGVTEPADRLGMISYEVLCDIGVRVPRHQSGGSTL